MANLISDCEGFCPILKKIRQKPRKSNAGRTPFDKLLMFKTLVLQSLYNLPDDQAEKKRQKDVDVRWTKKHGKTFYGYKNHVSVDHKHEVIRRWSSSTASVHDSQVFNELRESGYRSRIHRKGNRGKTLTSRSKEANRKRSSVRVEHVFGQQASFGNGKYIRTIGLARARLRIGMMNLAYNLKRLVWLVAHVEPSGNPAM